MAVCNTNLPSSFRPAGRPPLEPFPMARRTKKNDDGEQFTVIRTVRLKPSQAAELDAGAMELGASVSDLARELMFRRSAARPNVGTHSEAAVTKRQLEADTARPRRGRQSA